MPEQLTLRLRKPGVILLTGDPPACEAVRAALEALKGVDRQIACEVWFMPGASAGLQQSVVEHGGEVWECFWDADDPLDPATIQVGEDRLIARPTWGEAALAGLTDWDAGEGGQQGVDKPAPACPACLDGAKRPGWHAVDDQGNFSCPRCGRAS